jgi:hypothetical protein
VVADKDAERQIKTGTQLSRRKPGSTDSHASSADKPSQEMLQQQRPRNAAATAAARNASPAQQDDMQTPRLVKPAEFMAIVAVIKP